MFIIFNRNATKRSDNLTVPDNWQTTSHPCHESLDRPVAFRSLDSSSASEICGLPMQDFDPKAGSTRN
jgi:hypothetical protein